MYHAAGYNLGIKLLDNNQQVVLNSDGEDLFANTWGSTTSLCLTREETVYEILWNKDNCLGVSTVTPQSNQELIARSPRSSCYLKHNIKLKFGQIPIIKFSNFTLKHHVMPVFYITFMIIRMQLGIITLCRMIRTLVSTNNCSLVYCRMRVDLAQEASRFERLMQLFELNPRPLPNQLEILNLSDKKVSHGILLETPEPLDNDRVDAISLQLAKQSITHEIFHGDVKIIGSKTDSVLKQIEILLLKKLDLSGYQVEFTSNQTNDDLSLIFEFPQGAVYPAGTKIVIHNELEQNLNLINEHTNLVVDEISNSQELSQMTWLFVC